LSYAREIVNSPVTVQVYPGAVDEATSSAAGSGLHECETLHECSFVIHSRDTFGNNIYNYGNDLWNVSIAGMSDWAGYENRFSRVNNVSKTYVQHVNYTIVPLGWDLVGTADVEHGAWFLTNASVDFSATLRRGDTISVVAETLMVSTDPSTEFSADRIPLSRPFLGDSTQNFSVYKVDNCTTGKYLVTYFPQVRGQYRLKLETQAVSGVRYVEIRS
jgi:hypothetical protein